jgi:hypothetical protein
MEALNVKLAGTNFSFLLIICQKRFQIRGERGLKLI